MFSISLCSVGITFFVIVISGDSVSSTDDGTYCDGTGWVAYRDEKCYKLIKQWATRDEAKDACAQEGSDGSIPQLATIKSVEEQTYLTEQVFDTSAVKINVWIGAKRKQNSNQFVWDDGSEVGEFTNWAEGSPTDDEVEQSCVVMKSNYMKSNTVGQWRDVPCDAPNYVICEKLPRWSTTKLQQTLLETRKELKDSNDLLSKELEETKNQLAQSNARLEVAEAKIEETKDKLGFVPFLTNLTITFLFIVPIGFLYTQLPNEKAPSEIWPWMTWVDVSSAYAGAFFELKVVDPNHLDRNNRKILLVLHVCGTEVRVKMFMLSTLSSVDGVKEYGVMMVVLVVKFVLHMKCLVVKCDHGIGQYGFGDELGSVDISK